MNNQEALKEQLAHLKAEHRDLDDAILALSQRALPDMIQIQRLKKRKLQLRDEIIQIESKLLPDIIA
ncbi:MAG: YdcH family protein [Bdellovibrionales bacterium]